MTNHVNYSVGNNIASIALARPPLNAFSIAFLDEIIAFINKATGRLIIGFFDQWILNCVEPDIADPMEYYSFHFQLRT